MTPQEKAAAAAMTLPDFFERYHAPIFMIGCAANTLVEYRITLAHWSALSGDPPLAEIDVARLAAWKADLLAGPDAARRAGGPGNARGASSPKRQQELFPMDRRRRSGRCGPRRPLAKATVNKHLRHVEAILAKAGPAGPRNRDALEVLPGTPWVRPIKCQKRRPRTIDNESLDLLYRTAEIAGKPLLDGVQPAHWWQALFVCAYNLGFRRQALFALRWRDADLRKRTIRLPPEFDKADCERCKPLQADVVAHLERIRGDGRRDLVFDFAGETMESWYREWWRIQEEAGFSKAAGNRWKLHDFKRTCGSRLRGVADGWVVKTMLDHASITMTDQYVDAVEGLRPAVERMPQPETFTLLQRSIEAARACAANPARIGV